MNSTPRPYGNWLTVDINQKGVLDVDVVKGCTAGIAAHGERGCYQACYAATIAKFRGIDFSRAIIRRVYGRAQAKQIERAVKAAPLGFFRIGTMGDPCHAWDETVETVEWLAPYAVPIIITKHWKRASDDHLRRLAACGTAINTSVSAMDDPKHLARRMTEIHRYADMGGTSVARVVSCDFNSADPVGEKMADVQRRLLALRPSIDNPLRLPSTHALVRSGLVRLRKVKDLTSVRTISISPDSRTYLGHCSGCTDLCGAGLLDKPDVRPEPPQRTLFNGAFF
ncbi:MAG: hypothetical protein E6Q97_30305 [Desulfurellales bacterium]|nr:MAG: hypothetical protein E6Q97_30305 [Desulfurellales bacterium]